MKIELSEGKTQVEFERIFNQDTNEGIKYACDGWDMSQCAWRYAHIHMAVRKMGGWANYKYWTNKHSLSHFNTCESIVDEFVKKLKEIRDCKKSKDPYDYQYQINQLMLKIENEYKAK